MYLYELVGDDLPLAEAEFAALELFGKIKDQYLLSEDYDEHAVKRLGLCRSAHEILFTCSPGSLSKKIWEYDWSTSYSRSFSLRLHGHDKRSHKETSYASDIWNSLKNHGKRPVVNLKNPHTAYHIFFIGKKVYVCLELIQIEQSFESRKAHKLATLHPTALHPRLARVFVNLTGVPKRGSVFDPFCGTGGLLIEAALLGLKVRGQDNNNVVLKKANMNFEKLGIRDFTLFEGDSLKNKRKVNYIVSDLPYGLNTKNLKKDFWDKAFGMFARVLRVRACIGIPSTVQYVSLLKKHKLREVFSTKVRLHKSLTKRILVIEPKMK